MRQREVIEPRHEVYSSAVTSLKRRKPTDQQLKRVLRVPGGVLELGMRREGWQSTWEVLYPRQEAASNAARGETRVQASGEKDDRGFVVPKKWVTTMEGRGSVTSKRNRGRRRDSTQHSDPNVGNETRPRRSKVAARTRNGVFQLGAHYR